MRFEIGSRMLVTDVPAISALEVRSAPTVASRRTVGERAIASRRDASATQLTLVATR
jgi:hypothetical protein